MRLCAGMLLCLMLAGCKAAKLAGAAGALKAPPAPDAHTTDLAFIGWLAAICLAAGVVSLVASFTPWLAFFPRKSSIAAIGAAVGLWFLQATLVKLLGPAVWVLGAVAVIAAIPWVIAFVRWSIKRAGERLGKKHPDAGAALVATGLGLTTDKHKKKRQAIYDRFVGASP